MPCRLDPEDQGTVIYPNIDNHQSARDNFQNTLKMHGDWLFLKNVFAGHL